MASRFSENINKSKWCHLCATYKHKRCTGIRLEKLNDPLNPCINQLRRYCECTKCDNKTINKPTLII